jgi:hypothetical protein
MLVFVDKQEIATEKRQWNAERDDRLQQERKKYEVILNACSEKQGTLYT